MIKSFSIAQARHSLAALVHKLEHQPLIQLTRRGKPVAILLSQREYDRLIVARAGFWECHNSFRDQVKLDTLGIDPNLFRMIRDRSSGRQMEW